MNFVTIHFRWWKLVRSFDRRRTQLATTSEHERYKLSGGNKELVIRPYCDCRREHIVLKQDVVAATTARTSTVGNILVDLVEFNEFGEQLKRQTLYRLSTAELLNNSSTITCDLYNVLRRGKRQRVLSYSVYGSDPVYFRIIDDNLARIRSSYPGFVTRFYHDASVNASMRCHFECVYPDLVDFCYTSRLATSIPISLQSNAVHSNSFSAQFVDLAYMHKMIWRFLPIGDSFVDIMLSRDTDSFVIDREVHAVAQWLDSSNHIAHIMRGSIFF